MSKSPARIEYLTDVLTTAVEGGLNGWALVSSYRWSPEDPAERHVAFVCPDLEDDPDGDTEQMTVYDVDLDKIANALGKIKKGDGLDKNGKPFMADDYRKRIMTSDRF